MRALAALLVVLTACTSPPPRAIDTPSPTPEAGVLNVTALLDLSGPNAAAGAHQREALGQWLARERVAGAPPAAGAPPVKVRTIDVAGSEAKVLLELRRISLDRSADAVLVGAAAAYDDVLARAVELVALPVLFLEPIAVDPLAGPAGRWAFALAPSLAQLARAQVDDAIERGALEPSLVLVDAVDRVYPAAEALVRELARRGLRPPERAALQPDGSVPPAARAALPSMRGVECLARLPACRTLAGVARNALAPTYFYLGWTVTPAQVREGDDLWPRAIWPSFALEARGAMPSVHAAVAYDALTLLATAARSAGPDDPRGLRDALEAINMRLIATTYSFSPQRHSGADPVDIAFVGWAGSDVRVLPPLAFP